MGNVKNTTPVTAPRGAKKSMTPATPAKRAKRATAEVRPTDRKVAATVAREIATARKSSGRTREAMRVAILAAISRAIETARPVAIEWDFADQDTYGASGSYYGAHRPVNALITPDQRDAVRIAMVTDTPNGRQWSAARGDMGTVYIVPAGMRTRKTDPVPAGM